MAPRKPPTFLAYQKDPTPACLHGLTVLAERAVSLSQRGKLTSASLAPHVDEYLAWCAKLYQRETGRKPTGADVAGARRCLRAEVLKQARAYAPHRLGFATRPNDFAAVGDLRDRVYYHGTARTASAEAIWRDGIKPPEVKKPRGRMAPVQGRVYLTPDISYAMIYALGANMAGSEPGEYLLGRFGDPFGYVFAVRGSDLSAIQPDEDSVGEMVHDHIHGKIDVAWLGNKAAVYLTDNQLRKVKEGDYSYWAQAGKKLVKLMSPAQQEELVRLGAHVAQVGSVMPFAAWRIDRRRMAELKRDGSNFFDIAEPWGELCTRPNHHGGYHAPGDPLGNYERKAVLRSSSGKDRVVTFQRAMRQPGGIIMLDPGGKGPAMARTMMFVRESAIKSIEGPIENL